MTSLAEITRKLAAATAAGVDLDLSDEELDMAIVALLPTTKPTAWSAQSLTAKRICQLLGPIARPSIVKNRIKVLMARKIIAEWGVRAADARTWAVVLWRP